MSWSLFLSAMGMLTVIVLLIVQLMRKDQKIRALECERTAFKRVLWWARLRQTHRIQSSVGHEIATRILEIDLAALVKQLDDVVAIYERPDFVNDEVERITRQAS